MEDKVTSVEIPLKPEWYEYLSDLTICLETPSQDGNSVVLDEHPLEIQLLISLLSDLRLLGWRWSVGVTQITGSLQQDPNIESGGFSSPEVTRALSHRLRDEMLLKRRPFIESMEEMKRFNLKLVSIYSLMRDGSELAQRLDEIALLDADARTERLSGLIKPYVQFAEDGLKDEFTNLSLLDIWRYFRYTWSTPYTDAPVRSVRALVRDAAAENHPVIGIFELRSSVAQQGLRDDLIGWQPEVYLDRLEKSGVREDARWLLDQVETRIDELYAEDFINESIISRLDITYPRESVIQRLLDEGAIAREQHKSVKKMPPAVEYESNALMPLFRAKRAVQLANLLRVRLLFQDVELETFTKWQFRRVRENKELKSAITSLLKSVRSRHVGIHMMDLTTCGAVAPYSHLLGGKLVAMLATSPEVISYYNNKYADQVSDIASKMAGRAVVRNPQLCLLNTTSLYARNSSQYNRLSMPVGVDKKKESRSIKFFKLGRTRGKGTNHLSERTTRLAKRYLDDKAGNTSKSKLMMGEGSSPLLRNINEAGRLLGIGKQVSVHHYQSRILYTIPLAKNWKEVLLGESVKAKYLLPLSTAKKGTSKIFKWWCERWFVDRALQSEKIEKVRRENMEYPIRHGARVPLYTLLPENNYELDL